MGLITLDDVTKHKPYPIKSLEIKHNETDSYKFENLMAESSCVFEPIIRKNSYGSDKVIRQKFSGTIYINRPDVLSVIEGLAAEPREIKVHLGGFDNIVGSGLAYILIPSASITVGAETANKFFKLKLQLFGIVSDIHSYFNE